MMLPCPRFEAGGVGQQCQYLRQPRLVVVKADKAREAFEYVVKAYPESPEAGLSKQALDRLKTP